MEVYITIPKNEYDRLINIEAKLNSIFKENIIIERTEFFCGPSGFPKNLLTIASKDDCIKFLSEEIKTLKDLLDRKDRSNLEIQNKLDLYTKIVGRVYLRRLK